MNDLVKNKKIVIICIILILIVFGIYLFNLREDKFIDINSQDFEYLKNYKCNEIVPVYITEEDMVKKYLNEYKNNMLFNLNEAFNSLNKEYREKRFKDIDSYKNYIEEITSLSTYSLEVDKYSVNNINGNKVFYVYDKSGYLYIIKELSIMNFEIYLDEYTVDIK